VVTATAGGTVATDIGSVARYLAGHPAFSDLPTANLRDIAEAALRDAEEIRNVNAGQEKTYIVTDPANWRQFPRPPHRDGTGQPPDGWLVEYAGTDNQ
jgi:hypothetical protein